MTMDKTLVPAPDGHPAVFDREWPLRVADIDRTGRLPLDAAARHIQDVGQDYMHEPGFDDSHPLWVVRRNVIDVIQPIEFQDKLRLRMWCSGDLQSVVCDAGAHRRPQRRPDRVRGVLDQHQPRYPDALTDER